MQGKEGSGGGPLRLAAVYCRDFPDGPVDFPLDGETRPVAVKKAGSAAKGQALGDYIVGISRLDLSDGQRHWQEGGVSGGNPLEGGVNRGKAVDGADG